MELTRTLYAAIALAALATPHRALGADSKHARTIALHGLYGSHERGTATVRRDGPNLIVDIAVTGLPGDAPAQLAHLHAGPCDRLVLSTAIDLAPVVRGRSHTVLRGADARRAGATYVSVHKVLANRSMHVACGGPIAY